MTIEDLQRVVRMQNYYIELTALLNSEELSEAERTRINIELLNVKQWIEQTNINLKELLK